MFNIISVCGSDIEDKTLSDYAIKTAEEVGKLIAKNNAVLACGGKGGIMEAACKGAKEQGGITLGILPYDKNEANNFVDIAIPTDLGLKRNFLVVNSGDVVIAIGGRWGTLNEISYAMNVGKPVIIIEGTGGCCDEISTGKIMAHAYPSTYYITNCAEKAIDKAFELIGNL